MQWPDLAAGVRVDEQALRAGRSLRGDNISAEY